MFGIFSDFYSIYFGFFYELVLFMYPYELLDFICSFWLICNSFFLCSLDQNVQHIMSSLTSKFGDFRKFISIFKVCFGEEQKSCQNIKNSKPYFSKLRFKNSYKIIENSKNGK